ncbi:Delta(3,5)-Delta(2,4)-dienoyl-CoA isomerase, peroxisomal [Nymphon striatum]|nr:Delta(3,5)-Delta(2,4)-dienoyl-CoA isomerase, peroxisomal [Nymphon striatum]
MLEIRIENHVAEVVLNRPEKKNAIDLELMDRLSQAGEELGRDTDVRAVVLSGAGDAFSAGLDLSMMQSMVGQLEELRQEVPVVAAIHGVCFGAGMQLALGADFRIASPQARLSIMEAKWGLIPDMGLSQSLPRLVRADVAKELVMTGREVSGTEAVEIGLVTRLDDDPLTAARAYGGRFGGTVPDAIRGGKALVDAAWSVDPDMLTLEAELQVGIMGAPNQIETVMAQMQKRKPKF